MAFAGKIWGGRVCVSVEAREVYVMGVEFESMKEWSCQKKYEKEV